MADLSSLNALTTFESLPPEILLHIFTSFGLDARDLVCLSATCTSLNASIHQRTTHPQSTLLTVISAAIRIFIASASVLPYSNGDQSSPTTSSIPLTVVDSIAVHGFNNSWASFLRYIHCLVSRGRQARGNVSAGLAFSVATTREGRVFTWGRGKATLGRGNIPTKYFEAKKSWLPNSFDLVQYLPLEVPDLSSHRVIEVAAGTNHCLILTDEGQVFSWGYNSASGCCGTGDMAADYYRPVQVNLPPVVQVAAGSSFSAVVTIDGELYTFGEAPGQQGKGQCSPTLVQSLGEGVRVVSVSLGAFHMLVLGQNPDGTRSVFASGVADSGQLGFHGTEVVLNPRRVPFFEDPALYPVSVSAGFAHSLALLLDGQVFSWGSKIPRNGRWERHAHDEECARALGRDPYSAPRGVPAPVVGLRERVVGICAGYHVSHFIGESGTVYGCGLQRSAGRSQPVVEPQMEVTRLGPGGRRKRVCAMVVGPGNGDSPGLVPAYVPMPLWGLEGRRVVQVGSSIAKYALISGPPATHSMVVTEEGELYSFGNGWLGCLGLEKSTVLKAGVEAFLMPSFVGALRL